MPPAPAAHRNEIRQFRRVVLTAHVYRHCSNEKGGSPSG